MTRWNEPGEVTLIYVRESTGSRKEIKTRFDGLCIIIPREGSALVREGWKLERTIPPLAALLSDPDVSQSDSRIILLRALIEDFGKQYEACKVYCKEFQRNPSREFTLALGDVVYFGLI